MIVIVVKSSGDTRGKTKAAASVDGAKVKCQAPFSVAVSLPSESTSRSPVRERKVRVRDG